MTQNVCTRWGVQFLGAFAKLQDATFSFVMSVSTNSEPLDGFSWNLRYKYFLKFVEKIKVLLKSNKNIGYFTWRPTSIFISCLIPIGMKNSSDKTCTEAQNTHFMVHNVLFENHVIYEIMWKKTVGWGRPHITIWCMRIAYWIPNATNTHTHCFFTATMVA
jgi:hypothetical protein